MVKITLKGQIEPEILEGDFDFIVQQMQNTAAQGNAFIGAIDAEGNSLALSMPNILSIKEIDDSQSIFDND